MTIVDAWFALEKYSDAVEDYTKCIELNPKHYDAFSKRGLANMFRVSSLSQLYPLHLVFLSYTRELSLVTTSIHTSNWSLPRCDLLNE